MNETREEVRADEEWEDRNKSVKTFLCTDPCVLCNREGKKVGGLKKEGERKQPGR